MPEHDPMVMTLGTFGLLDASDEPAMRDHLDDCADCTDEVVALSRLQSLLESVPPEAFLDGPPEGGDLLLRRTLRRARTETRPHRRIGRLPAVAAALALFAAIGGGVLIGRTSGSSAGPVADAAPANAHVLEASNKALGVSMTVAVVPEPGWVQVHARFRGVTPGTPCKLIVQSYEGDQEVALSWIAPSNQPAAGVALDGAAVVTPQDIASVKVVTFDGRQLVATSGL